MLQKFLHAVIFVCAVVVCSIIVACMMYLFEFLGAR